MTQTLREYDSTPLTSSDLDLLEEQIAKALYYSTKGRAFSADDLRATINIHLYFEDTQHDIGQFFQKLLTNDYASRVGHTITIEETRHNAENKLFIWLPKAHKKWGKTEK